MFAYCDNSPVCFIDTNGEIAHTIRSIMTKVINVILSFSASEKAIRNALTPLFDKIVFGSTDRGNLKIVSIYLDSAISDVIYKYYNRNSNRTINVITNYVVDTFYNIFNRHIVFSNACISDEIESHLKGYWWCEGDKNVILPNVLLLGYSVIESVSIYRKDIAEKLLGHCSPIDISEKDIFVWTQRTGFNYKNGIRNVYYNTSNDPFYYPNENKRKLTPRDDWNIQ